MNDDPAAGYLHEVRSCMLRVEDDWRLPCDWNNIQIQEQRLERRLFYRFDDPTSPVVQRSLSDRSCGSGCHNS